MSMTQQDRRTTLRNLAIFTAVVLASGWIGRAVDRAAGAPDGETPGMLLWLVLPLGASLLLRAFGNDGWKDLGLRPNFSKNAFGYSVALLLFPLLTMVVLAAGSVLGLTSLPGLSPGALVVILQVFLAGLLPEFVKNIFEEAAWRGYLAPKVRALGLHDMAGHTVVGVVWGAWHIPYYLFYLDRAVLREFTVLSVAAFIPLSIVVMVAWSMVYGEIQLLTGSVWPAVLMHMVEDAFLNQLFIDGHVRITAGADWLVSPVNGVISILLFAAVGIGLRQYRLGRERMPAAGIGRS